MRKILLCLAFLPTMAQAQDIVFSTEATLSCMQETTDQKAQEDCVGASANVCMMATPDGSRTNGISTCLRHEYEYWDARLNTSYRETLSRSAETDAQMIASGAIVPSLAQALKDMQRAWIPFRDTACAYQVAQWSNGSGRGPAGVACLLYMTAEQTLLIEGPNL